jgi:hypothetical protein
MSVMYTGTRQSLPLSATGEETGGCGVLMVSVDVSVHR